MRISKIKIENIRGIESKEFELNIPSNNPIIIVAPNGFGKTSIATAFSSLKAQKIDVAEEDDTYAYYVTEDGEESDMTVSDYIEEYGYPETQYENCLIKFRIFILNE